MYIGIDTHPILYRYASHNTQSAICLIVWKRGEEKNREKEFKFVKLFFVLMASHKYN